MYLGATQGIASYDEVKNAINIRENSITEAEANALQQLCKKLKVDIKDIGKKVGAKSLYTMTSEQHGKALIILQEIQEGLNG